jgi:hypothetical protein
MAAGDAVVKGYADFTEQPYSRKWVRSRGWYKVREWHGPLDDSKINTLTATLTSDGRYDDIDIQRGWPTVVTASIPDDDAEPTLGTADDTAEWDLEPYELEKTLGTHGAFNASQSSAPALAVIDAAIKKGEAYGVNYEALYPSIGALNTYAILRGQGVESYLSFAYRLRRTVSCTATSTFLQEYQAALKNSGKIVTWAEVGVPTSARIERPWVHMYVASIWTSLTLKSGSAGGWADVYFDEWMVKPPGIRYVREGKVRKRQIVQEFLGALAWSVTLYDGGKGTP